MLVWFFNTHSEQLLRGCFSLSITACTQSGLGSMIMYAAQQGGCTAGSECSAVGNGASHGAAR